jgi:hypothetical protein
VFEARTRAKARDYRLGPEYTRSLQKSMRNAGYRAKQSLEEEEVM